MCGESIEFQLSNVFVLFALQGGGVDRGVGRGDDPAHQTPEGHLDPADLGAHLGGALGRGHGRRGRGWGPEVCLHARDRDGNLERERSELLREKKRFYSRRLLLLCLRFFFFNFTLKSLAFFIASDG